MPYDGPDVYEPSKWVLDVVGSHYKGYCIYTQCLRVWTCTGYDPRSGFWLKTDDDLGPPRLTNVSERAIDRTFHRVV